MDFAEQRKNMTRNYRAGNDMRAQLIEINEFWALINSNAFMGKTHMLRRFTFELSDQDIENFEAVGISVFRLNELPGIVYKFSWEEDEEK